MSGNTFEQNTTATNDGAFDGLYIWGIAGNWSSGVVPTDGGTVTLSGKNVDDLQTLSLASVTASASDNTIVAGSLDITNLTETAGATFTVSTAYTGAAAKLTVGSLSGSSSVFVASDAGATIELAATVDQNDNFYALGGTVIFDTAAVAATGLSNLLLSATAGGEFAFKALGAPTNGTYDIKPYIYTVGAGDTFELPSGVVQSVSYGASTITVAAGGAEYVFQHIGGYAVAPTSPKALTGFYQYTDAATGLQAIVLSDAPAATFQQTEKAPSGSLYAGQYVWSDPKNWVGGAVPLPGASITLPNRSVDDIASLSLTAATIDGGATSVGGALTIGNLAVAQTGAGINATAGNTLTLGGITGTGGVIEANGAGAVTVIDGAQDSGENYFVSNGGLLLVNVAPSAASSYTAFTGGGTFAFAAPGSTAITAALTVVGGGSTIELPGSAITSVSFGTSTLTVDTSAGNYDFTNVSYIGTPTGYTASHDATTGLEALSVQCFLTGTRIATPAGEIAVESLAPGDAVCLADGGTAPVRWIARHNVASRFGDPMRIWPVRICAGALAEGVPSRDLLLSPGHAVRVGGVLAHAAALVNGRSIRRETPVAETFTYWHVELDTHALILAENTPAESFLDGVEDLRFDNAATRPVRPDDLEELPYPRAKAARQVPRAVREALAARIAGDGAAACAA